jgi:hypothetical protein
VKRELGFEGIKGGEKGKERGFLFLAKIGLLGRKRD